MSAEIPEPVPGPRALTRDPVRVGWVINGFIQAVIAVLLGTGTIGVTGGAIIVGVSAAGYVAFSELFVRPETVPRGPLNELARAEELSKKQAKS